MDAVLAIRQPKEPIDLHMVEIMEMQHKMDIDTMLVFSGIDIRMVFVTQTAEVLVLCSCSCFDKI